MRRALLPAGLLALAPSAALAAAAQTGAAVLRLPLSASVAAMGQACASLGYGVSSMGVNAAGVAAAPAPQLETTFHSGVLSDAFGFVGYAHPTRYGTPFAGVAYYNSGTVNLVFSNGTQNTVTAEEDFIEMLGWALPLGGGVTAGVLGRAYRFTLAQEASATGFAGDAGLQWATPLRGLRLGAAVQNAGPGVKFEQASDPLPLTGRAGASYTLDWRPDSDPHSVVGSYYSAAHLTFSADAVKVRDETAYAAAAGAFAIDVGSSASIVARLGFDFNPQAASGLSYGLGLREGRFTLDYTQAGAGELGNVQYVSLGMRF